jgi:hypothetical protein
MINEEFKKYLENSFNARDTELFTIEVEIRNFKYSIDQIETNYSDNEEMMNYKKELENILKMREVNRLKCLLNRDSFKKQLENLTNQSST